MKLQAAVDKLFSHKLFLNKYFLYAVVAASVLTNYMRIVDCHYEVVGFFILVGIIMMNFSKNVAVVLTVCLLLTQIIMAGKAVQEGFNPNKKLNKKVKKPFKRNPDLMQYMTPEIKTNYEQAFANLRNVNKQLFSKKNELTTANTNIKAANDAIRAAKKKVDENSIAYESTKRAANNAPSKERQIKQSGLKIATDALNTSKAKRAAAIKNLANNVQAKPPIEAEISELRKERTGYIKDINDIETVARNARKARKAKKAKKAAEAATSGTRQATKQMQQKKRQENAVSRVAKAATAATRANPFKGRNRFALLSDNDNDIDNDNDYENNGIDLLEPPNLTSITQGTTNLMTKQKDLFSVMNSMTPLIENAKKMLKF